MSTWQRVKLGDCLAEPPAYGANASAMEYSPNLPRYIRITDIDEDGNLIEANKKSISLSASKGYLLRTGDIVFARTGATVGKTYLHIDNGLQYAFAGYLIRFRTNENCLLPQFLSHYSQSLEYDEWVLKINRSGAQPNINASEYSSLRILLPPLLEQIEIARILSRWDAAIAEGSTLLAAKTRLKRALMQQLLTGKRRFREFVHSESTQDTKHGPRPTDWSDSTIGDFTYEVSERMGSGEKFPVLSCTKHAGLVDSLKYFGKRIYSEDIAVYKVVRRDQFAYATNHIEEGSIGLLTDLEAGVVSPMYTVFGVSEKASPAFLYLLFKTEMYRQIFASNTSASVDRRGSLRWRQFSQIRVALPSIAEQEKIAETISIFDKEIQLLQTQLAAWKQQKKGLMQKLLGGQVRVK